MAYNKVEISIPFFKKIGGARPLGGGGSSVPANALQLEDVSPILLEDGTYLTTEA